MQIIGCLSEFAWIEICKFVERTDKSGLLKIQNSDQSKKIIRPSFISGLLGDVLPL
ncbi:MAG: hypothetical protein F6K11_06380 [Leptolyngbya sp. SIO3F4]|nr:hypothetical protein [Leptolyngbya sp. SIO3F4]